MRFYECLNTGFLLRQFFVSFEISWTSEALQLIRVRLSQPSGQSMLDGFVSLNVLFRLLISVSLSYSNNVVTHIASGMKR